MHFTDDFYLNGYLVSRTLIWVANINQFTNYQYVTSESFPVHIYPLIAKYDYGRSTSLFIGTWTTVVWVIVEICCYNKTIRDGRRSLSMARLCRRNQFSNHHQNRSIHSKAGSMTPMFA